MSITPTLPGIESLTLIVTQEIHVRLAGNHVRGATGSKLARRMKRRNKRCR